MLGASGAIYGLLLAFGMLFPEQEILIAFLFPIKAKYMVMIFGGIAFVIFLSARADGQQSGPPGRHDFRLPLYQDAVRPAARAGAGAGFASTRAGAGKNTSCSGQRRSSRFT